MKRKWDVSSKEQRRTCIDEVLARLQEQDDVEFGILAAEEIIDIVLQNLAPDVYNVAVKDVRKLVQNRLADLDVDFDLLQNDS